MAAVVMMLGCKWDVVGMAVETGLRWSELHSLTRSSFDFTGETATITIAAESAKNRKEDALPLRPELAQAMKARMALFLPDAKAFPGMWEDKGAAMLRVDLEAAGIPAVDEYGCKGDFHALRHTFASLLNQAHVPLATAQKLMRHSDPKLTANIYTHVMVETKAEALSKLPMITATFPQSEAMTMTGTDAVSVEGSENRDNPRDTFSPNFDGQIKTYMNNKKDQFEAKIPNFENEKTPVPQGQTGVFSAGTPVAIRTRDLRFRNSRSCNSNAIDRNVLREGCCSPDNQMDTFSKNAVNTGENAVIFYLSPDLAGIVSAWSSVPELLQTAIKDMLRQYLTEDG